MGAGDVRFRSSRARKLKQSRLVPAHLPRERARHAPHPRHRHRRILQFDRPDWRPLLAVAREIVEWFMWMHEVELSDGTRIHAYKHCMTRRYLHLDTAGAAHEYTPSARYRRGDLADLLEDALLPLWDCALVTPPETTAAAAAIARARGAPP